MAGLKQIHCKLGKSNLLAGLKQIQIRISVLNFVMGQISAAQYQAECYLPSSNGPHRTGNNQNIVKNLIEWNIKASAGQPLGLPSKQATGSWQAKERPELFWLSFPVPKALNAKCMLLHVSKDKKTWLVQTQVRKDFHWFQLTVHIRHYQSPGLMHCKEKDVLRQIHLRDVTMSSDKNLWIIYPWFWCYTTYVT